MNKDLIAELLSAGIRVPDSIRGRKGGAGPADGRAFLLNGLAVNIPIAAAYVADSPYQLRSHGEGYILLKNGTEIGPIGIVPAPHFYQGQTADGIGYSQIALLHGKDCLATTVNQRCFHWQTGQRCKFCGTEISLHNGRTIATKRPGQLVEVARYAQKMDGVSHVVLTSGTGDPPGSEIPYLARRAEAIKQATGLPVHVQFIPPKNLDLLDVLLTSGVDTVGIHIESFDSQILARLAPAKAAIGLQHYERTWKKAVALFGPNQVSSFLIAGLGESPASIVWGSEILADLGVYPFVVPFRPIPGSRMENNLPPDSRTMMRIYTAVARILKHKGLAASLCKAGCVRCGACSALPAFESRPAPLICHSVRTEREKAEAYAIRHEVFVKEQKLFEESDVDANDAVGTLLVAKKRSTIIGTVRIYPVGDREKGPWIGGRLAVRRGHRVSMAGALLVKEAMKRVKKKGCTRFTAHIQESNVPFFEKLGWKPVGALENYVSRPHQLMEADLGQVPEDLELSSLRSQLE